MTQRPYPDALPGARLNILASTSIRQFSRGLRSALYLKQGYSEVERGALGSFGLIFYEKKLLHK